MPVGKGGVELLSECGSQKQSHAQPSAALWAFSDYYFLALGVLLAGYAVVGKLFAYISVGPVYIGDFTLALGIIAFLKSRCAVASLATLPSLLLGILFGWAITRVLPYLGEFGINALRDSAIIVYGGFAFIVIALLLERPERLPLIIRFLRVVSSIVILIAPVPLALHIHAMGANNEALINFTPPDVMAIQLAGAGLLMLLGFRRAGIVWCIPMLIGMAIVSTISRSCLFAIIIPITLAAILTGKLRALAVVVVPAVCLIGLAYAVDLSPDWGARRQVSAKQIVDNVVSTFDSSNSDNDLEGTRTWRIEWWKTIINYTFNGSYFWTGKGFGVNLALSDGFLAGESLAPLNRNPHNSNLNILARTGVPGFTLWLLTLGTWSTILLTNMVHARMRGENAWADFFVFVFCYVLAIIIDSCFSIPLEGPMISIWFWSLFGVGIAASMIYRAHSRGIGQYPAWQAAPQMVGST